MSFLRDAYALALFVNVDEELMARCIEGGRNQAYGSTKHTARSSGFHQGCSIDMMLVAFTRCTYTELELPTGIA